MQKLKSDDEQRSMIADYKSGVSYGEVAQQVKAKKNGKGTSSQTFKKKFGSGGIAVQVTAKKRPTQAEIAAVLRAYADELENDGRSRRAA